MNDRQTGISPEWRDAAADALRSLQIAQRVAANYATPEAPAPVLVPAIVFAMSLTRVAGDVVAAIDALAAALAEICPPDLSGIESNLDDIATTIHNK